MTPHAQSYHIITQIGTGFVTDFKHQNPAKQLQQVCTFLANPKVHSKCRCVWFFPRAAAAAAHFAVESEVTAPSWLAVLLLFRKENTEPMAFLSLRSSLQTSYLMAYQSGKR